MIRCEIVGLDDFRSALSASAREIERDAERGQQEAGEKVLVPAIAREVPRRSGRLAAGYEIQTRNGESKVLNREAYGRGAEWGRRGKWAGFHGTPPRYAGRVLEARTDELANEILQSIDASLTVAGWFRG